MPTERAEIAAIGPSECLADRDGQIESLRHGLDPADEVDRGADHGEIEPRGGADIAVDDNPAVECHDHAHRRLAEHGLSEGVAHCRKSLSCCSERPLGCLPRFRVLGDREDRQQAITDEFQYLAAMALDRDRLRVENSVEHGDDVVAPKAGRRAA